MTVNAESKFTLQMFPVPAAVPAACNLQNHAPRVEEASAGLVHRFIPFSSRNVKASDVPQGAPCAKEERRWKIQRPLSKPMSETAVTKTARSSAIAMAGF